MKSIPVIPQEMNYNKSPYIRTSTRRQHLDHPESKAGYEQVSRYPAVVLSPRSYNRKTGLAILCPVTSQIKGYLFEVLIPEGLPVSGASWFAVTDHTSFQLTACCSGHHFLHQNPGLSVRLSPVRYRPPASESRTHEHLLRYAQRL